MANEFLNDHILNIFVQLLAYSDPSVTDNPHQRAFDHRRNVQALSTKNPYGNSKVLAPGQAFKIFDGVVASSLSGASVLKLSLLSATDNVYRLEVTSGPSGFRTARTPSGLSSCAVTINNESVAVFDFTGATLNDVAVGDIMRIKGSKLYDAGPTFAFNPLNSGLWKIIGISGTKVSCVRLVGELFEGAAEAVTSVGSDIQFYADDGILAGTKMAISGSLSVVSQRVYEVKDATPTFIDFVSAIKLPEEENIAYISGSVIFYVSSKKIIYIEADQDCVIRYNNASDDSNKLTPLSAGDSTLPGISFKIGDSYSCEIINKSINQCRIKFFTAE